MSEGDAVPESFYLGSPGMRRDDAYPSTDPIVAFLIWKSRPDEQPIEIPITPGIEIRFGREDLSQTSLLETRKTTFYVINDPRVSKAHFRIYTIVYDVKQMDEFPPQIYCGDLESTNGTFLNGVCVGRLGDEKIGHLLCDGDVVEIKPDWQFEFRQSIKNKNSKSPKELEDIGQFKERFQVTDRVLGKGHYGAVYLAKEMTTSRQMACKIVNLDIGVSRIMESSQESGISGPQSGKRETGKEKIMREIKILAKLSHPNIVNLRKAYCSENSLYIFTDLAPAGDLYSYVQYYQGCLHDLQARMISRQLLLAVEHIHAKGIIHRDIKPENVLVMEPVFAPRVVLTDFGFANKTNLTGRSMSKLGTEGYIAPEVESSQCDKKGYTVAADLYSLGMVTAMLLTGNCLVPREEMEGLTQRFVKEEISQNEENVTEIWKEMSQHAKSFVRHLLDPNDNRRLTATEALSHVWLKDPQDAELIEKGCLRLSRFWKSRTPEVDLIQHISNKPTPPNGENVVRLYKHLPDASASPYFGLERRLNKETVPKVDHREQVLKSLEKGKGCFLSWKEPPFWLNVQNTDFAKQDTPIKTAYETTYVEGSDIFGKSLATKDTREEGLDSEEGDTIDTTVGLETSQVHTTMLSAPTPIISSAERRGNKRSSCSSSNESATSTRKRARIEIDEGGELSERPDLVPAQRSVGKKKSKPSSRGTQKRKPL